MRGAALPGRGAVAAGHAATCEAAVEVLRAGGNACDAALAAGFVSAVCEPALTSLGGGGFLLSRRADGQARLYDFFVDTPGLERAPGELEPHFVPVTVRFPGSEQVFHAGAGSAAVPGTLAGFLHVHGREGRLPLAHVTAPAVGLARDGVLLNAHQAYFLSLLRPIVTMTARGRAVLAPRGPLLAEGERLRNPALADFLVSLPGSADDLYRGGLARRIEREMEEGQGLLTAADLAAYAVAEREPLAVRYRDSALLTNPPPSFGGPLLALALGLLEATPPAPEGPASADHACALLAVMEEADRLRDEGILAPGRDGGAVRAFGRGTTHVSVWDGEGNAASMTTSNGEGSGYWVPEAGILLNNMLGEDDLHPDGFHATPPGRRVASMMSPSVLLAPDGAVRLVLGSGGSKRIRTALLQVLSLVADFGRDARAAVEHPRLHWDGARVQVEPGLPDAALRALQARRPTNLWPERNLYFGGVNAVEPGSVAAGDPRRGGTARRA